MRESEFVALGGSLSYNLPGKQDILPKGVLEIKNKYSYQFQTGELSPVSTDPILELMVEDNFNPMTEVYFSVNATDSEGYSCEQVIHEFPKSRKAFDLLYGLWEASHGPTLFYTNPAHPWVAGRQVEDIKTIR